MKKSSSSLNDYLHSKWNSIKHKLNEKLFRLFACLCSKLTRPRKNRLEHAQEKSESEKNQSILNHCSIVKIFFISIVDFLYLIA